MNLLGVVERGVWRQHVSAYIIQLIIVIVALIILNHSEFSAVGALQPISGPVQCPAGNATTTNCQRLLCLCVELSFVDGSFPQVQSGVSENGWDGHRNYDCIIRWNWGALSSVKPNSTGDNE